LLHHRWLLQDKCHLWLIKTVRQETKTMNLSTNIALLSSAIALLSSAMALAACSPMNRVCKKESVTYPADTSGARETRLKETRLKVIAKPEFKRDRVSCVLITIRADGLDSDALITWPAYAPDHSTLDASIPWHFELLRRSGGFWGNKSKTEVLRIRIRNQLVFDASICEIHHHLMTRIVEVPDEFSGRRMPGSFLHCRDTQFPHSGTGFYCDSYYPNENLVWRCSDCAASAKVWCHKNANDAPYL